MCAPLSVLFRIEGRPRVPALADLADSSGDTEGW